MSTQSTILVVDDTEANVDILLGLLNAYDVLVALDGETALELAAEETIDLILLDIVMPGMDGYETCRRLKDNPATRHIPVVFITAKTDEDSIEEAYEVGGLDYVTKPFKPRELLARVKTQLKLKSLIEHLDHLSSYDPMTGVFNRRKFFEQGNSLFAKGSQRLYAMMLDIDHFKQINDCYGHPTGDRVIKAMASSVAAALPDQAILGRLGGEEFAVLSHFETDHDAVTVINDLRQKVSELSITSDCGKDVRFTLSGGLARVDFAHGNLDQLLKEADDRLYEAKGEGRNRAIFRSF